MTELPPPTTFQGLLRRETGQDVLALVLEGCRWSRPRPCHGSNLTVGGLGGARQVLQPSSFTQRSATTGEAHPGELSGKTRQAHLPKQPVPCADFIQPRRLPSLLAGLWRQQDPLPVGLTDLEGTHGIDYRRFLSQSIAHSQWWWLVSNSAVSRRDGESRSTSSRPQWRKHNR